MMLENIYFYILIILIAFLTITLFFLFRKSKKQNKKGVLPGSASSRSLKLQLSKTKNNFWGQIGELLKISTTIDDELLNDLEEALIKADVGVNASLEIIKYLQETIKKEKINDSEQVKKALVEIIRRLMEKDYLNTVNNLYKTDKKPLIILFTGVNGVGKTTSIGKLAKRYTGEGKKVMLIAADTFRAAAIEQLTIWADRAQAEIAKQSQGSDPSAVVFDGLKRAANHNFDVVLIDTAGRQHTKVNLMNELNKIDRTIKKIFPDAPHESLLVVDATTGQNALTQAENFNRSTNLTGLVLTKLDGTAKGGIVIGIKHQVNIPVKLIGVGEKAEDLRDFEVTEFLNAIFE